MVCSVRWHNEHSYVWQQSRASSAAPLRSQSSGSEIIRWLWVYIWEHFNSDVQKVGTTDNWECLNREHASTGSTWGTLFGVCCAWVGWTSHNLRICTITLGSSEAPVLASLWGLIPWPNSFSLGPIPLQGSSPLLCHSCKCEALCHPTLSWMMTKCQLWSCDRDQRIFWPDDEHVYGRHPNDSSASPTNFPLYSNIRQMQWLLGSNLPVP